jgi:hypothetical protein
MEFQDARLGALERTVHGEPYGGGAAGLWSPELLRRRAAAATDDGAQRRAATEQEGES